MRQHTEGTHPVDTFSGELWDPEDQSLLEEFQQILSATPFDRLITTTPADQLINASSLWNTTGAVLNGKNIEQYLLIT
jgi:hypothetical protein